MKTITVIIDTEAKVSVETNGYKGKACSLDSKVIEQALGVVTKDVKKPEFSQDVASNQSIGA